MKKRGRQISPMPSKTVLLLYLLYTVRIVNKFTSLISVTSVTTGQNLYLY